MGASQKDHVIVVLKFCVKKLILVPEIIEYYLATLLLYVICIYECVLTLYLGHSPEKWGRSLCMRLCMYVDDLGLAQYTNAPAS